MSKLLSKLETAIKRKALEREHAVDRDYDSSLTFWQGTFSSLQFLVAEGDYARNFVEEEVYNHLGENQRRSSTRIKSLYKMFPLMSLANLRKQGFYQIVVLSLTLWGFVLRIYDLSYQSLWNDEASSINAALGMLKHGLPILPSDYVYSRSILNTGIIALSLTLFGDIEFAARFPSVIFGTLTIPLVFLFTRKLGNEKIALIATIITTFSMLEIAWARQARMYQQLQFFYILSLYFFYQFLYTKSKHYLILTLFFTFCTILSHEFGFTLILIFVAYTLLLHIRNLREILKGEFLLQKSVLIPLLCAIALLALGEIRFGIFSTILTTTGSIHLPAYLGYLVITLPMVLVLAIAGGVISFRHDGKASLFLILSFLLPFYFFSFHLELWGYRYLYFLLPIIFILSSYAVVYVADLVPDLGSKPILRVMSSALLLGLTFSSGFVFFPQRAYYHFDPTIQQPDFKKAYRFIQENMNEDDVIIDAWPVVGILYLDRTPDYSLVSWYVEATKDGELVERFTRASYIQNLQMLKSIVEGKERGWLIVDTFAWHLLPPVIQNFIVENLIYYEKGSNKGEQGDIMVYGWRK